jgi:hypothetical protein
LTLAYLGEVFVFFVDVEGVVDIGDLQELGEGGGTLLRWPAGMLCGTEAFWGELQPILYQ